jgi:hypothetical protein
MEKLENPRVYIKRIDYGQKKFTSIACFLSMTLIRISLFFLIEALPEYFTVKV